VTSPLAVTQLMKRALSSRSKKPELKHQACQVEHTPVKSTSVLSKRPSTGSAEKWQTLKFDEPCVNLKVPSLETPGILSKLKAADMMIKRYEPSLSALITPRVPKVVIETPKTDYIPTGAIKGNSLKAVKRIRRRSEEGMPVSCQEYMQRFSKEAVAKCLNERDARVGHR
jgi:hypothetical protein